MLSMVGRLPAGEVTQRTATSRKQVIAGFGASTTSSPTWPSKNVRKASGWA